MGRILHIPSVLAAVALVVFLAWPGFPTPAGAGDRVVTVATLCDYRPYCFLMQGATLQPEENLPPGADSTQLQGFSWDVVRESLHEMGYTIRLLVAPWERAMSYVKQGKADVIFPAARTDERLETLVYSREIVNRAEYVIYVPADRDIRWNGLEGLFHKRIAMIRGWSYGPAWDKETRIVKEPSDDILQCFRMLDRDRVYGVAGYDLVFDHVLKQHGMLDRYRKLPPFDRSDEYLAGARTNPVAMQILEDFDHGKRRIVQRGLFQEIASTWR